MKLKATVILIAFALVVPLTTAHAATSVKWNSRTKIMGTVTIPVDTVVTVAPNTKITVGKGAKVVVLGQLLAPKGLTLTGSDWQGLVIKGSAVLTNFVEVGARESFFVETGGVLEINGGDISGIKGPSSVDGTFTAKNITYIKGPGGGITSSKATGSISVDGGKFSGPGRGVGDFFSVSDAELLSVTNSSITAVHCAFHITGLKKQQ